MPEKPEAKQDNLRVNDLRVLVVAPVGRDAKLICNLLARAGVVGEICDHVDQACAGVAEGAGAAILAEEALTPAVVASFAQLINEQPSWSDFPLIVLTVSGEVSERSERRRALREPLGNVLLLERPIRPDVDQHCTGRVARAAPAIPDPRPDTAIQARRRGAAKIREARHRRALGCEHRA
jgi:CheY-like chemotaxis protein